MSDWFDRLGCRLQGETVATPPPGLNEKMTITFSSDFIF